MVGGECLPIRVFWALLDLCISSPTGWRIGEVDDGVDSDSVCAYDGIAL